MHRSAGVNADVSVPRRGVTGGQHQRSRSHRRADPSCTARLGACTHSPACTGGQCSRSKHAQSCTGICRCMTRTTTKQAASSTCIQTSKPDGSVHMQGTGQWTLVCLRQPHGRWLDSASQWTLQAGALLEYHQIGELPRATARSSPAAAAATARQGRLLGKAGAGAADSRCCLMRANMHVAMLSCTDTCRPYAGDLVHDQKEAVWHILTHDCMHMCQVLVSAQPREEELGMDEGKRTAILGAMKNFSLPYMPSWAAVVPEQTWVGLLTRGQPPAGSSSTSKQ